MSKNQMVLNIPLPSDEIIDKAIIDEMKSRAKNIVRNEQFTEVEKTMETEVKRLIESSTRFDAWNAELSRSVRNQIEDIVRREIRNMDIKGIVKDEMTKFCESQTAFYGSDLKEKCKKEVEDIISQAAAERIKAVFATTEQ